MDEVEKRHTQQLLPGVAGDATPLIANEGVDGIPLLGILQHDNSLPNLTPQTQEGAISLLALPQCRLRLLALGDVDSNVENPLPQYFVREKIVMKIDRLAFICYFIYEFHFVAT